MKASKELRALGEQGLQSRLTESKKELLKLRVQVATGTNPEKPARIRQLRKTIARIITLRGQGKKGG
ncbi:MAG: 50S ribosomal protein L29 [Nanoarchaeota archaeon]